MSNKGSTLVLRSSMHHLAEALFTLPPHLLLHAEAAACDRDPAVAAAFRRVM